MREQRPATRRKNWTLYEIGGLIAALVLLAASPVAFIADAFFPPATHAAKRAAALTLSKTANVTNPNIGDTVTYTITFSNTTGQVGPFTVTDAIPAGLEPGGIQVTPGGFSATNSGSTFTVSGSFASTAATTLTVIITTRVDTGATGQITNTATISGAGSTGSGSATITVGTPTATPTTTAAPTATTAVTNTPTMTTATTATATATTATTNTPTMTATGTTTATATNTATRTAATATPTNTTSATTTPTTVTVTNTPTISPTIKGTPTHTPRPTHRPGGGSNSATDTPTPTGVVSGVVTRGGSAVAGAPIQLVRVGSTTSVVDSKTTDTSGGYFFGGVAALSGTDRYVISFANGNAAIMNALAAWSSAPFAFNGSPVTVPTFDVADVGLGSPGDSDGTITPPTTFTWTARKTGDGYALDFAPAATASPDGAATFSSGALGNVIAYTLPAGALGAGDYTGFLKVVADGGTGIASRAYRFRIATGPTATLAPGSTTAASGSTAASGNTAATRTPGSTPAPARTPGGTASGAVVPTVAPNAATPATGTAAIQTRAAQTVIAGPTAGNILTGGTPTAIPQSAQPGQNPGGVPAPVPETGGELPIAGLVIAALTILSRRVRLVLGLRRA